MAVLGSNYRTWEGIEAAQVWAADYLPMNRAIGIFSAGPCSFCRRSSACRLRSVRIRIVLVRTGLLFFEVMWIISD